MSLLSLNKPLLVMLAVSLVANIVLYFDTTYWYGKYSNIKQELKLCKQQVKHGVDMLKVEKESCERELQLVRKVEDLKVTVPKQIQKKIDKGKDYEILAAPKPCGCHFDGTGWVFH